MSLNPEQFSVKYPYPRLRESYARDWATTFAGMLTGEGTPTHPVGMLEAGRDQAIGMVEMHMTLDDDDFAKRQLISGGFKNRRDTQKTYSSWFN